MATAMYKKLAIGALIIGPLTVQVLTTTVPTEPPAPGADNVSTRPPMRPPALSRLLPQPRRSRSRPPRRPAIRCPR
jgi:hypothetical protein